MAQRKLNQYKSIENKNEYYFVICKKCGSIEWLDFEEGVMINNTLRDNGQMLSPKKLWTFEYLDDDNTFLCQNCETPNQAIPFSDTTLKLRKKLAEEQKDNFRRKWVRDYIILKHLKEKEEKPNTFLSSIGNLASAFFSIGIIGTALGIVTASLKSVGLLDKEGRN